MKFSIKTKGFYDDKATNYPDLPDDLQEISEEDYEKFFNPPEEYAQIFDDQGPRLIALTDIAEYEAQKDDSSGEEKSS